VAGDTVTRICYNILVMKHQKIIVGNWKMNPTSLKTALTTFKEINTGLSKTKKVTAVICPPFIYTTSIAGFKNKKASLGAQNVFPEIKGSFTGEVSIDMLKDAGVSYIILGHSERRKLGESNELVNKKVLLALKNGITPILCVGEATRDEEGHYLALIKGQIEKSLAGVNKSELQEIIIAYEPVWAIGATEAMNARDVHEMTIFIKKTLVDLYRIKGPTGVPILYGGAVDPTNAQAILTDGDADGLLIGRQSLEPTSFLEIISIAQNLS
jgi:triosephosphate isomerase (TIM)